jgi:hypothetical protein
MKKWSTYTKINKTNLKIHLKMKYENQKRKIQSHSFHKVTSKNEAMNKKRKKSKFIKKWNTCTKKEKLELTVASTIENETHTLQRKNQTHKNPSS